MNSSSASEHDEFLTRLVALIGVSTLLLTASFVGVVAFLSGEVDDSGARFPWYLVVGGLSFVGSIILLEAQGSDGRTIIVTASLVMTGILLLAVLGVEGVIFAIERPELVFNSNLVLYFLSAALVGVGVGYWGLKHWREFAGVGTNEGL